MEITRSGLETIKGPDTWFTGDVYIDPVAAAPAPGRVQANLVHFTPGARAATGAQRSSAVGSRERGSCPGYEARQAHSIPTAHDVRERCRDPRALPGARRRGLRRVQAP